MRSCLKSVKQTKEEITDIKDGIEDDKTGLLTQIEEVQEKAEKIEKNKEEETEKRAEENKEYQAAIKHAVSGQVVVKAAIKVLKLHYEKEAEKAKEKAKESGDEPALLQVRREDPPKTWDKDVGQSKAGNKVIGMLEDVLKDMVSAEMEDHDDEQESQEKYEEAMEELTTAAKKNEQTEADLRLDLAKQRKDLVEKKRRKRG